MTIKIDKLGWPVAAALAGAMATSALSGFQANTAPKFATVDMTKVAENSNLIAANKEVFDTARRTRADVLDFIVANRAMDTNDAKKFAEISTKATPTPADRAETDRLRAAGLAATTNQRALSTKTPLTDPEKAQLDNYGKQAQANGALLSTLQAQFQSDLQKTDDDLTTKAQERIRDVVRTVGVKQGYTVVFSVNAAPYAANDLTDEATKALKK